MLVIVEIKSLKSGPMSYFVATPNQRNPIFFIEVASGVFEIFSAGALNKTLNRIPYTEFLIAMTDAREIP